MEYDGMKINIAPNETLIMCKDQETIFGKPKKLVVTLWHKDKGQQKQLTVPLQDLVDAYVKLNDSDYR